VIPGSITMMLLSLSGFIPLHLLRILSSVIILGLLISYLIVVGVGILLNCIDQCNQWSGINRLIVWTMDIGYVIGLFRFILLHGKSKK
ncbi:MAG TPA: hypothetical protein VEP90_22365, partial [Methylomirabilota bacterium]|nr:hypothetical protein [Methylomirabilota bacterium]